VSQLGTVKQTQKHSLDFTTQQTMNFTIPLIKGKLTVYMK